MTRRMQRRHGDPLSDLECLPVGRRPCDRLAVSAADYGELECLEDLIVASGMVPVAAKSDLVQKLGD